MQACRFRAERYRLERSGSMGKIFYIIGKSSTGKDTLLENLLLDSELSLHEIIQYTTRPRRDGEEEGREYHFISMARSEELEKEGKVIEARVYQTVHGPWKYMMVDDGQLCLDQENYAAVGTIEAYRKLRDHFGEDRVVPLYIYVETGERLQRALDRERTHEGPKYAEMCRRFLSDEADFDDAHLKEAGLIKEDGSYVNGFENAVFETLFEEVKSLIKKEIKDA